MSRSRSRSPSLFHRHATSSDGEIESLLPKQAIPPTPLPKIQLAVIYAIKLSMPIAHTQASPYYNLLFERLTSSDGAETGYYSGLSLTLLATTQFISMSFWGRASDTIGRKPVIFIGTSGLAVLSVLLGLSDTLRGVLLNRAICGIFAGITGAIHSVVGELSDDTNASTAFPLYDIISALGFVIGPLIGGTFADPAKQFPGRFTHPIWAAYPYLLPCLISGSISLVAAALSWFALEETLPSKRRRIRREDADAIVPVASLTPEERPLSPRYLFSIPVLRAVYASSAALGFAGSCFNNGFVLMAYVPVSQGGLSFTPSQIGRAMSGMGAVSIAPKLCMPHLLRRFGTLNMFSFCMVAWVATFGMMPLMSWVAKGAATIGTGEGDAALWSVVAFVLFLSRLGCLAFSIIMILTKDHTPSSASLGTSNGLAELAQSLAGMLGPSVISSLFAVSVSKHLMGGYLWVAFMLVESGFGVWVAHRIRAYRSH